MPTCLNLMQRFGRRYRITFDPAYSPKHRRGQYLDPWMMMIPCQRGTIYPEGGDWLRVDIDYRPITARAVGRIPGVELYNDGDHEKTFRFHVSQFAKVAAIVKPRLKRRLSGEHTAKLLTASKPFRRKVASLRTSAASPDASKATSTTWEPSLAI